MTSTPSRAVRRLIVVGLERACVALDRVTPDWRWRLPGRACRLAVWSALLDERWNTGHWQPSVRLVGSKDDEMECGCIPYEHQLFGPCEQREDDREAQP